MKFDLNGISNRKEWEEKGYALPGYDIAKMREATIKNPFWVHFGAGNLFRAFHAKIAQDMLDSGVTDRGLIVVEGFDYELIDKIYLPHDNLNITVTLNTDGTVNKDVIGSVAQALVLDSSDDVSFNRLKEIFSMDSLQMVTFTITEKGYSLTAGEGKYLPDVEKDFENGPGKPLSYMGKTASLLYARYKAGKKPVAMVSTDNCSHNGDKLYEAVLAFAKTWAGNKKADAGFVEYINSSAVSFTWSMIDKITPRPDDSVWEILKNDGLEDAEPVITSKNTYSAPFVNTEKTGYLVIEDDFPNGRPGLEAGRVIFADRDGVDKTEKMKVCTCLNPLHTCLAVFGCLLGYHKISDEMEDECLVSLIKELGYKEGLLVAADPGILNPEEFIKTVIEVRLPNPFMPDSPQRIATDTSQKLGVRFGETVKAYMVSDTLSTDSLECIPLVYAGWLRYLMGTDDNGDKFDISPDPLLSMLKPYIEKLEIRPGQDVEAAVGKVLEMENIFGVNLYEAGLAKKVCRYLSEMTEAAGAVRRTLERRYPE